MENGPDAIIETKIELHFDLGYFYGYNLRDRGPFADCVTAEELVNWNHVVDGEAEFWPNGEHAGVQLIFNGRSLVPACEVIALDKLLSELGGDDREMFFRINFLVHSCGADICTLTAREVKDKPLHIFVRQGLTDLHHDAAHKLFQTHWPEAYNFWVSRQCDGLYFRINRFLSSPCWLVQQFAYEDNEVLIACAR